MTNYLHEQSLELFFYMNRFEFPTTLKIYVMLNKNALRIKNILTINRETKVKL